ncbi:MAG: pyridoxal phosphate-dependent aminotransferase [Bacteriovorax sp.]|nr:pyridoxal phosphate-dependent aminotransferase [Bacteriovorax sp.]
MTTSTSQAFGLDRKISSLNHLHLERFDLRIGEPKISPFPTEVFEELSHKKNINCYYPSHGDLELREMIIDKFYEERLIDNIAITHGTMGALDFIFRANLNSDSEILLPDPGFPPYTKLAEFSEAKVKKYSLNLSIDAESFINWDQVESLITKRPTLLLLNSPHNPTGKILTDMDLVRFEEMLFKYPQLSFVMDEVYRSLIYGQKTHYNFSSFINRGYIVGSFSKMYPLQGARIGWVLTSTDNMKKLSPYFNNAAGAMSSFGQEIVKSILKKKLSFKKNYYEAFTIAKEILDLYRVDYVNPDGAFFLFIKYEIPDLAVVDELAALGVEVVPGSAFGSNGANYIRASFAQQADILQKAFTIIGKHWKQTHPSTLQ